MGLHASVCRCFDRRQTAFLIKNKTLYPQTGAWPMCCAFLDFGSPFASLFHRLSPACYGPPVFTFCRPFTHLSQHQAIGGQTLSSIALDSVVPLPRICSPTSPIVLVDNLCRSQRQEGHF